jgi:membrane protein DedA with SNARE-associated domain
VSTSKQNKDEQVYTNGEVAGIAFLGLVLGASITTAAYFVGRKIHQRRMRHRQFRNEI